MTRGEQQFELARRLCAMADELYSSRCCTLGTVAVAVLREQIDTARGALLDDGVPRLIGYEASCLIELMAELSYARLEKDQVREDRAMAYLRPFRNLMRGDLDIATRRAAMQ